MNEKVEVCSTDVAAAPIVLRIGTVEAHLSKAEGAKVIERIARLIQVMFPDNP